VTAPDTAASTDHPRAPGTPAGPAGPADRPVQGLFWSHEVDLAELLAAAGGSQLGEAGDEAAAAEEADAADAAEAAGVPLRDLTVALAEQLPAGPGLAALISRADPEKVTDWDLPGLASSWHRIAAWAQAKELAAVANIASRSRARDDPAKVGPDGRPDKVTPAAASEVGLELNMSQYSATSWTNLAVTLQWRLAATGQALTTAEIDQARAKIIAEATGCLDEETARKVEGAVLGKAGRQTTAKLRHALREAIIAADPEGADQRREDAERNAKVSLYPNPDTGTASLNATDLPAVHAAAAFARLTALARAMKSAGQGGGLDLLRAQALIGLLLGTLPFIPPAPGAPPDCPPDDDADPGPGHDGPGPGHDGPGPGGGQPGPSDSPVPGGGSNRPGSDGPGDSPVPGCGNDPADDGHRPGSDGDGPASSGHEPGGSDHGSAGRGSDDPAPGSDHPTGPAGSDTPGSQTGDPGGQTRDPVRPDQGAPASHDDDVPLPPEPDDTDDPPPEPGPDPADDGDWASHHCPTSHHQARRHRTSPAGQRTARRPGTRRAGGRRRGCST
jgi:hypothetical protein